LFGVVKNKSHLIFVGQLRIIIMIVYIYMSVLMSVFSTELIGIDCWLGLRVQHAGIKVHYHSSFCFTICIHEHKKLILVDHELACICKILFSMHERSTTINLNPRKRKGFKVAVSAGICTS
jgi:hypothetical protein